MAVAKPGSQIVPRTSVVDSMTKSKTDPLKAELARLQGLQGDDLLGLASATGTRDSITGYTEKYDDGTGDGSNLNSRNISVDQFKKLQGTAGFDSGKFSSIGGTETYNLSPEERLTQANAARQQSVEGINSQLSDPSSLFKGVEGDMIRGAGIGEAALGPDGLGRLGEDAEVQDSLQRFKNIADQGLSRQEVEAERTQAFGGIDRNTQTSARALQGSLARSGVKGALAGQQQMQLQASGLKEKAGVERDLFLKSEGQKREGLKDYSSRLGDVKTFDIGQAAKEKDIALQTGLAFAQMGSAKDIAKIQAKAAESAAAARQAAAPSCFMDGTMVRMADNSVKAIESIQLGDELTTGLVLSVSQHLADGQDLYTLGKSRMTGNHIVLVNDIYIPVMYVGDYTPEVGIVIVYDLIVEGTHRIELEDGLFTMDQDGFNYDAQAMADTLNEIEGRNTHELTEVVSAGEV